MCGSKQCFSYLDEKFKQFLKLGSNSKMIVLGRDNIRLQADAVTQEITNVFYILELRNNLLSVGQF